MKSTLYFAATALFFNFLCPARADATNPSVQLSLNWSELAQLWAGRHQTPVPPPRGAFIEEIKIHISWPEQGAPVAEFHARIRSLQNAWPSLTLVESPDPIAVSETSHGLLARTGHALELLCDREGVIETRATFQPSSRDRWTTLEMKIPAALIGRVTWEAPPDGRAIVWNGEVVDESINSAPLPPHHGRMRINLIPLETAKPLPTVEAEVALVSKMAARTELAAEGGLLCSVEWEFDTTAAADWPFRLPPESQLLRCSVDGRPTRPGQQSDGSLVLALPEAGREPTQVKISYTMQTPPWQPLRGRFDLLLPTTEWFVRDLDWTVALPSGYRALALEGNLTTKPSDHAGLVRLHRGFLRGVTPELQLFYEKPQEP